VYRYDLIQQLNRPGFPGECFICELRLSDHRFRWKHNKLFLLLPVGYGPAFPAIVDCYTAPEGTRCGNYAFDVTPARYITGFITERGVCAASKSALADMFADLKSKALQGEQH